MSRFIKILDNPPLYKSDRGTVWQGDGADGQLKSKWYYSLNDGRVHGSVDTKGEAEMRVAKGR